MKLLALIILICGLQSCQLFKKKSESVRVENHYFKTDSTHIIERQTLDTFNFPKEGFKDSVGLDILKALGEIKFEQGRAQSTLSYEGGMLHLETMCDSIFQVYVKEEFSHIQKSQQDLKSSIAKQIEKINKTNSYYLLALLISGVVNFIFIYQKFISWQNQN